MGVSNYPAALDDFAGASPPNLGDNDTKGRKHAARHDDLETAMEAVQAELGTTPSGAAATVAARFTALDTTVSGKANATHSHAQGDITGLVARLDASDAQLLQTTQALDDKLPGEINSIQPTGPFPNGYVWVDAANNAIKVWDGTTFVDPSNAGSGGGPVWAAATGGTETSPGGGWKVHTFTGNGTLTVSKAGTVEGLLISGGAGAPSGGYLGSGGDVRVGRFEVPAGALAVTVGPGGNSASGTGMLGSPSSLGTVVATGIGTASQGAFNFLVAGAGSTIADPTLPLSSDISGTVQTYGLALQSSPRANRGDGGQANVSGSAGIVIVRYQV